MTTEYSATGDPKRTIELLWGLPDSGDRPKRGPKARLSVEQITAAAIELADAEGLGTLSMRRVADRLGIGAMSLYTYVPGKAELLDLMLDTAYAELPKPEATEAGTQPADGWRQRLERRATDNWRLLLRHPWMLDIAAVRPVMGPHLVDKYEHELRAVEGIGLSDLQMDAVTTLVSGFVESSARLAVQARYAESRTGVSDEDWWAAYAPMLDQVIDWTRYPTATRVGSAAGAEYRGAYAPERAFEFGLARILDGIAVLLADAGANPS